MGPERPFISSDGTVDRIHLNDLNPGIAAFWRASLDFPNEFCRQVRTVPLTIDEWHRQAEIYANPSGRDDFELGFATFYLNRTNRSGILDARPIGGFEQLGRWKIDARFNREALCARIQVIADLRHRIYVTEYDALDFLDAIRISLRMYSSTRTRLTSSKAKACISTPSTPTPTSN